MEQQTPGQSSQPNQFYNSNGGSQITPNSTGVLVLGILSIVCCWCYGVASMVLGIIALVLASAGEREYKLNPQLYSISSYKNLKAGKTCAIIGLCLSGIAIVYFIVWVLILGAAAFSLSSLGLGN